MFSRNDKKHYINCFKNVIILLSISKGKILILLDLNKEN